MPHSVSRSLVGAATIAVLLVNCDDADPTAAPNGIQFAASGTHPTLLGRGTFGDATGTFKVKRISGDWHVEVKAKPNLDVAVQTIVFDPGGQSGWHTHPGPVFIQVVSGTMTFYESDDPNCTPIVRPAATSYLDVGEHAHIAINETSQQSENLVVYLAPPGAPLRTDAPSPGNCPF